YWPSYNIPFHEKIYNLSGYTAYVRKYGLDFSYELAPRAKIFRRDQGKVTNLESMKYIMRYNNYQRDPYAERNPCNTICCREDLNPCAAAPRGRCGTGCPPILPPQMQLLRTRHNQKSKDSNPAVLPMKEDNFSDKNKEHIFFITDSEPSGGDFWRDIAGEHTQETNSPHSLKKDVENMGKEELRKVLFEQIDLQRRLEEEFQVLKGNASFPVF
ncbi:PREDICTED: SKI family transcriptional corepressor 2-like, partial [Tinamus guttatus]|uniref:SKI family transcriptional corepressor 2-like n=1 Tax=Tinamus guttatus TaxID=94827 RepID=UPI00052EE57B